MGKHGAWGWDDPHLCYWHRDWARVAQADGTMRKEPFDYDSTILQDCVSVSRDHGDGGLWADEVCDGSAKRAAA